MRISYPGVIYFNNALQKSEIRFNKLTYFELNATVVANPSLSQVTYGMPLSDYVSEFSDHHFVCTVELSIEYSRIMYLDSVITLLTALSNYPSNIHIY